MKAFPNLSYEQIMDGISYQNLLLLQASIPPYRSYEEKNKKGKSQQGEKIKHFSQFGF